MAGDAYFYILQAEPSRVGILPLFDLPKGLELYLSDTLAFSKPLSSGSSSSRTSTVMRVADNVPETHMMKLTLDRELANGNPFGFGESLLMGKAWQVVSSQESNTIPVNATNPIKVRGNAFGGDGFFLFCRRNNDDIQLLSALSTNGRFREQDDIAWLSQKGFGRIVLPEPFDYWLYDGPHFGNDHSYQRALMNPGNWIGFNAADEESLRPNLDDELEDLGKDFDGTGDPQTTPDNEVSSIRTKFGSQTVLSVAALVLGTLTLTIL